MSVTSLKARKKGKEFTTSAKEQSSKAYGKLTQNFRVVQYFTMVMSLLALTRIIFATKVFTTIKTGIGTKVFGEMTSSMETASFSLLLESNMRGSLKRA
jgi:hypothetical protein